ncbi:MAG: DUF423 domain-containing protein [Gammaproteobacteria bacterium]|nr:DUF423 domain-containing protein [Gammaproteobacteria bacterium]
MNAAMPPERWMAISCVLLALAVMFGAFGAHALRGQLEADALRSYQVAVDYHFSQAIGLFLLGLAARDSRLRLSGPFWLMLAALLVFCGSLYALALTDLPGIGILTPVGGIGFVLAWTWAASLFWRHASGNKTGSD